MDLSIYPMKLRMRDNTQVLLRPLESDDYSKLVEFFRGVPEKDILSMEDDVTDTAVIKRWCENIQYEHVLPLLAFDVNSRVVADAVLRQSSIGWQRHIGEVTVTVKSDYQHKGLGTLLIRQLVHHAIESNLNKVLWRVIAGNTRRIEVLRKLEFREIARISQFIIDLKGRLHDMVIMQNDTLAIWDYMADLDFENLSGVY